jgi:hypothetical protein
MLKQKFKGDSVEAMVKGIDYRKVKDFIIVRRT